ncbi:hypothetical protein HII36_37125 [Nonomuraea sp. NN258]|uniref:hypothetical protein n=1 Tax=Nonomuraea antri TaxID=2730852 RepID=UPI0015692D34|nr:hypothetical protein [Nonomuraea antri]NRQ37417.1 hypothetical protein [Nonomuraea antri]
MLRAPEARTPISSSRYGIGTGSKPCTFPASGKVYIPYAAPMSKQTAPGRTKADRPSSLGSLSETVAPARSSAADRRRQGTPAARPSSPVAEDGGLDSTTDDG